MSADEQDLVQLGFNPQEALHIADRGGWTPVNDVWAYASASTITVPTDATLRYGKGMKIRLKQGAGYKYFYITGVAATVLTVTGGTDYTVANSAITDVWYSYFNVPLGLQPWLNWTPTCTCSASMTFTSVSVTTARFYLSNTYLGFTVYLNGTVGGTPHTTVKVSTPVTPSANSSTGYARVDSAGQVTGFWETNNDGNLYVYRQNIANWSAGAGMYVICSGGYEIA